MKLSLEATIIVKNPVDLTGEEIENWNGFRRSNPALYSPYFHVDYARLLGRLRDDASVAIAMIDEKPVSFLTFQGAASGGFARPLGAPMSDYHGFVESPGTDIDRAEFLKAANIGALHYQAMVGEQADMEGYHRNAYPLCLIDLTQGVETWREAQSSSYRRNLKKNRRRIRRTEEEYGARRFEFNCHDQKIYNQLMVWKKERFAETGLYDVLSADWTSELLLSLWQSKDELRCEMHALYFGDILAAIDMGLTDGPTFHSWMVAYNPDFHNLSPGTQLLEALIDEAPKLGYGLIDLGAGTDSYKSAFAVEDGRVHSGFMPVAGAAAALSKIYGAAESFGEKSLGDIPGKIRRRYTQIADCDKTVSGRAKAMLDAVKTGGSR
ncbi:MAG: GNAT family N-acetyltransferase [Hellea sp.]|nr:GNAT family N-acetyltransferase [Hellea sp.]